MLVVVSTLVVAYGFISESRAFPPFAESEINKTNKEIESDGIFEIQLNEADENVKLAYKRFLSDIRAAKGAVDSDNGKILQSLAELFESDLFDQCYQRVMLIIADIKKLYRGSQKELKPVSKYVAKEWKGVKKDLNIHTKNRGTNNFWGFFDNQIKDTKEQLHNFVADPRLLQLKSRFDKGNHKII